MIHKCECQPDTEIGDIVTVHKCIGTRRNHLPQYAIGKRPVMNSNGPSYTYQGENWYCVGTGTVLYIKPNHQTLDVVAGVKMN